MPFCPRTCRRWTHLDAPELTCAAQVGYSLNALVDFSPDDPIAIIKHLIVGSEGTLAFISSVTYNTVPKAKFTVRRASCLVQRPDACSVRRWRRRWQLRQGRQPPARAP
jgi:D-lactate dehydrogenase